jgi:hypothetical protein
MLQSEQARRQRERALQMEWQKLEIAGVAERLRLRKIAKIIQDVNRILMKSERTTPEESWLGFLKPALLAALAGVIAFTLLVDPSVINPSHVGWLASGDPASSYLGWLFFRQEPWSMPLGLNHTLGMEQGSSIVYSDSIPLLAIFFKIWRAWLPSTFQYDGLWLCACYALQGYFAYRLLRLFTDRRPVLAIGVLLFVLSPIMLFRVPAHLALSAHWIIVAALYLYYAPPQRRRLLHWLVLLWIAPLIHAYLMFMAYAVWVAYLLRYAVFERRRSVARTVALFALSVAGSLLMMWLAGYFLKMEVSSGGFGYYSMNLLAPFWPVGIGWLLPHSALPATPGQYEGFNYLGMGIMLALAIAAWQSLTRKRGDRSPAFDGLNPSPDLPLIIVAVALSLMAISNEVTWGSHVLFVLPMPARLQPALNVFRASGRMFWPVYYLLMLAAIRGTLRLTAPMCARFLVVILVLQMVDMFSLFRAINTASTMNASTHRFPAYTSPFWALARSRYDRLYVIPGDYKNDDNIKYESLANAHEFAIDTVYTARLPVASVQAARTRRHEQFFEGVLDQRGLYLVQSAALGPLAGVQPLFPPNTGVGQIDGFTVVAPQWLIGPDNPYLHKPTAHDFPEAVPGRTYSIGKGGNGESFLLAGWSEPGDGGTWSDGPAAALAMHVPPRWQDVKIVLDAQPYLPTASPRLGVDVRTQGVLLAHWQFERGKPAPDTMVVLAQTPHDANGNIVLSFSFDSPRSPQESGESIDARKLALLLRGVSVQGH